MAGEDHRVSINLGFAKRLQVSISGTVHASQVLASRARRLKDFRPLWLACEKDFQDAEENWFATEGSGTWKQLAPSTVEARTQKLRKRRDGSEYFGGSGARGKHYSIPGGPNAGPSHKILQWTSEMLQDLRSSDAPHAIRDMTTTTYDFGTSRDRAGWNDPVRNVLPRRLLELTARTNSYEFVRAVLLDRPYRGVL